MKKILIIEDDLIVRSIYRRKFEMAGYKVETAEDGSLGLSMVPTFLPDVIQVDIMLPGIDGVEVIRQIRSWPEHRAIPILVLSSFYRPDMAQEAWKAGATKCVSKMDCTPNLALDLIEQLLSGEVTGFRSKFGTIEMPKVSGELRIPMIEPAAPKPALGSSPAKIPAPTLPSFAKDPGASREVKLPPAAAPRAEIPAVKIPTRPTFATDRPAAPAPPAPPPTPAVAPPPPEIKPPPTPVTSGSDFRSEIRQEFLRRAPQIQGELRDRVGALLKSKSITDQLNLLHELDSSVHSLASLAGITGFGRIAHLSGAMSALIKEIHKKPSQMTSSVLRTIAHATDCLNLMFRDLGQMSHSLPQSILILVVDDEPISRRTLSLALSKANLRCVGMEDSLMALNVLKENPFDLIFLDAEMPGMTGFELCTELRKLPTNKATPVIFVTSLTKFEVRAQSSLSGGSDLIAKPFLMMELAVKALTYLLKPAPTVEANPKTPPPEA